MFLQIFQFRLGRKTTIMSCKGYKDEASVCVVSTMQFRYHYADDHRDCVGPSFIGWHLHLHPDSSFTHNVSDTTLPYHLVKPEM